MRLVPAFLAILALLISPVTAAAAQVACAQDGQPAMASMDMSAMPGMDQAGAKTTHDEPCCDRSAPHGKIADCVQACAAMCGVTAALVSAPLGVVFTPVRVELPAARIVSFQPYEPPGLRRPPKSIA